MKINFATKTIEITKSFASKATNYGPEEYRALLAATRDLPTFQVQVKATYRPCQSYSKGLTFAAMESYISTADQDGSIMQDFLVLRQGCRYIEVQKWFLTKFPEFPENFAA